jgi:nucleoid-associated protein Lsr2
MLMSDGNRTFELDVCRLHLDELVRTGRRVRQQRRSRASSSTKRGPAKKKSTRKRATRSRQRKALDMAAVRDWARSNGYTVGDRDRIPASIVDAYRANR